MMKAALHVCIALVIFVLAGCSKPLVPGLDESMRSTNVLFTPRLQDPIRLSSKQTSEVKRIILQYNAPSVRREKSLMSDQGRFTVGDLSFGWFGSYLAFQDPRTKRCYIVEDKALAKMESAFNKAEQSSPLHYPSREQWEEILRALETGEKP